MFNIKFYKYLLLGVIIIGCNSEIEMKKEIEDLLETDRSFSKLSEQIGAADAFREYLDSSAVQLPHLSMPIFGRENIYKDMKAEDDYLLIWEPKFGDVSNSGDIGYTWGEYKVIVDDEIISTGKYLNVWKRQNDGSWKVVIDMGNQNSK